MKTNNLSVLCLLAIFCCLPGTGVLAGVEGRNLANPAPPIIRSPDFEGTYYVGQSQNFQLILQNPTNGARYNLINASLRIANAERSDINKLEIENIMIPGLWHELDLVRDGQGGLVFRLPRPMLRKFFPPDGVDYVLNFRINFAEEGNYQALTTLYDAGINPPVVLCSLQSQLETKALPEIKFVDAEGPYVPNEGRSFGLKIINPDDGRLVERPYLRLTFSHNSGEAIPKEEIRSMLVQDPFQKDVWHNLDFLPSLEGLTAIVGPFNGLDLPVAENILLTFKLTFAVPKKYTLQASLLDENGVAGQVLAQSAIEMDVVVAPTLMSDNLVGPYQTRQLRVVNINVENPLDGGSFSALQTELVFEHMTLLDIESVEARLDDSSAWKLLPVNRNGQFVVAQFVPDVPLVLSPGTKKEIRYRFSFRKSGEFPVQIYLKELNSRDCAVVASLADSIHIEGQSSYDIFVPFYCCQNK